MRAKPNGPALAGAGVLLVALMAGCSSSGSPSADRTVGETPAPTGGSSLSADCAVYQPLSDAMKARSDVVDEYNTRFPFLGEYGFRQRLYTYDYGSGDERLFLMGDGKRPASLKGKIPPMKPFFEQEKEYIRQRVLWKAQLDAVGVGDSFSPAAAALWPNVVDPDLKESIKVIADNEYYGDADRQRLVERAFISADSKCGF